MKNEKNFTPVLRFMVVSDVHIHDEEDVERERFTKAIRDAYALSEADAAYNKLDALYVVGDFANSGSEIQMRAAKKIIDENIKPGTLCRLTMASHEFHTTPENGEASARALFAEVFPGYPLDSHEVINGFHFIAVTTTHGCSFREPQKAFARDELKKAAAEDSKKPIFFFQHPHLSDTVYGSINWGEDELIPILMNYPQVIDFSGHSHAPINDPRSIHQKHFTALGTGSLSYFELDEFDKIYGTIPPNKKQCAQMLIVEADENNRVRIYPYDVLSGTFFPMVHRIDTPSDPSTFLYTDERYKTTDAPSFAADAAVTVEAKDTSAVISFPQAKPEAGADYVNSYTVVLRYADGMIAKQFSVWSEYYFVPMPETVSQEIDDLEPDTEYTVEVYPEGFFKNRGKQPLKGSFKTF